MSFLSDLASLAKAGYKPSDVKELLELTKTNPDINTDDIKEKIEEELKEAPKEEETVSAFEKLVNGENT